MSKSIKTQNAKSKDSKQNRNTGRSSKSQDNGSKRSLVPAVARAWNDKEWYAANEALLRDSASISYNTAVGTRLPIFNSVLIKDSQFGALPGVCRLDYLPGIGYSDVTGSAINIAAKNMYSYVRHVNSGHANYESADLMLYVVAMDSLYSYIAYLRRVYGVLMQYSQYNRYMPETLVRAMGIDFTDMVQHIVDLRYYVNRLELRVGAFVIPSDIPFFKRHMWMSSNVYMDSPTVKAQFYVFTPTGFYRYEEMSGAGKCVYEALADNMKFADVVAYGEKLLASIMASEDCGIMSGDILKAFGDKIFKMDALDAGYTVEPVYVAEVLDQIQNATILGTPQPDSVDITQTVGVDATAGAIMYQPKFVNVSLPGTVFNDPRLLAIHVDNPDPGDTMVATRLMVFGKNEGVVFTPNSCGTEVITAISVYRYGFDDQGVFKLLRIYGNGTFTAFPFTTEPASYNSWLTWSNWISCFAHHPAQYLLRKHSEAAKDDQYDLMNMCFEVDNYTVVDSTVIDRMHETAILSMLNVPVMGNYSNKLS